MLDKYVVVNNQEFAYRFLDGEAVVVSLKDSTFFTLNEIASFIWRYADGKSTVKDIVQRIHREFHVDYPAAEKDCLEFIEELKEKDMLLLSKAPL